MSLHGWALYPSTTRMARRIGFVDASTLVADGHKARPCKALYVTGDADIFEIRVKRDVRKKDTHTNQYGNMKTKSQPLDF